MSLYYTYSDFLKNKYGVKTYKLTVNLPLTCPNRDGTLGTGGCDFCGEKASGFVTEDNRKSVYEQLTGIKDFIAKRYGAEKFIAYFQSFTNTYLPLDKLIANVSEVHKVDEVVEIALATRPDCINKEYIEALISATEDKNLTLEFGLQTVNYRTLSNINRGHTLAEFIDAVLLAKKHNVEVSTHLILNLPGDNMDDVIENAKVISALDIDTVKLHALYIRENSKFGEKYKKGELQIITLSEYIDRVITFLEYLDPDIAIQRLLGKAPEESSLFVNWDKDYRKIIQQIKDEMSNRKTHQGKRFNYLHGKALKKFE